MELLPVVLLSATIGIGVGVMFGFLLLRRGRGAATEGGAAGKAAAAHNLATVVAAPTVTIEDLRKLLTDRDQTLQQSRDDLKQKQQQLEAATAAAESAAALRAESEQRATELVVQANTLADQLRELTAKTQGEGLATEEAGRQIAALQAQVESEKVQGRELAEQIARLTSDVSLFRAAGADAATQLEAQLELERTQGRELTEQLARLSAELTADRAASAEVATQLQGQLESEKTQSRELAEQVAVLTIDLTQSRQYGAEADSYRSSLEAELGVGRLKIMQLTDQLEELNRERSEFEVRLREERQFAARGIELLNLAQSTFSGAFQRLQQDQQNGNGNGAARPLDSAPVSAAETGEPVADSVAMSA
jgi:chromosome segregation ATPase